MTKESISSSTIIEIITPSSGVRAITDATA
jgi:hypothetical protein